MMHLANLVGELEFRHACAWKKTLFKSYSSMLIIENSIPEAWCGGITVPLPPSLTGNFNNVSMCMGQSQRKYLHGTEST